MAQRPPITIFETEMSADELASQPEDYQEAERVGQLLDDYVKATADERVKLWAEHGDELEAVGGHPPVNVLDADDDFEPMDPKDPRSERVSREARQRVTNLMGKVRSGYFNLHPDVVNAIEELAMDAELPDEVGGGEAAQRIVNLLEAAEFEHRRLEPFGRVVARQETPLGDGSFEVREVDAFGKAQTTRFSAREVEDLESEYEASEERERRPWGGDDDAKKVSLEEFESWGNEQQFRFMTEHPSVVDAIQRETERAAERGTS